MLRNQKGFTLLELLISMSIFVISFFAIYKTADIFLSSLNSLTIKYQLLAHHSIVLAQVRAGNYQPDFTVLNLAKPVKTDIVTSQDTARHLQTIVVSNAVDIKNVTITNRIHQVSK